VSSSTHIAVVDDETEITLLLAGYLQSHGFRVSQLHNGAALLRLMAVDPPQLVLLDLGLPGEDGLSIARQLRDHWHCGLVIVTGRGDAVDKVVGLEVGADDYVTKPFDLRELLARSTAVLRRTGAVLVENAGRVLSRDFLLEQTRGREAGPFDRTIDVQVGRLRKKLEVNVDDPQIIKSVRGAGYILVAPVSSE
jgi:two-component system OmpR family response regulator